MSKLQCTVATYHSSTWLEPSIESLLESPIAELSLNSGLLSISIPQDLGKYLVHQAEPLYLARLNTTGRSPGIPEGACKDRLTHCHHPLGTALTPWDWGLFFKVYSFRSAVFCTTGSPLVGCGSSPRTDGLGRKEAIIHIYHPWRIARAPPQATIITPR
jgi:hypothetical protein